MDCQRKSILNLRVASIMFFAFFAYVPLMVKSEPLQANPIQQDSIVKHLIKGKILNKKKGSLPGVTARLDSTLIGTSSDNNGNYRMFLPINKGRLVFSFIGYKTKTIPFSKADTLLNVILEEDVSELDEVQVIAYGEQSRRNRVGSMSVVKADEIKDLPSPSINNLLQGRAAGVDVTNMTGAPGGGGSPIVIRGYNSLAAENGRVTSDPLWVIDGVPMFSYTSGLTGLNTIAEIDTKDIESIQILKDAASAAIYGSRAANGVIIVTTKKGHRNQPPTLGVNISQTWVTRPTLPDLTTGNGERRHRMQAMENYREAVHDEETNRYRPVLSYEDSYKNGKDYNLFWNKGVGLDIPIVQDSLNKFYNNSTNLFDYYFQTGKVTDANIQISGGSSNITYHVGLGYYTETGVLRNTGFNRIKLITNLFIKPFDRVESNIRFYLARTGRNRAGKGHDAHTFINVRNDLETIPDELLSTSTLMPGPGTAAFDETVRRFNEIKEKNESYRLRSSFDLAYTITDGLKLKSSLAVDFSMQDQNIFMPPALNVDNKSYSSGNDEINMMWLNENLLSCNKTLADGHTLDVLLGLSFQGDIAKSKGGYGKGAPSDLIRYVTWSGSAYDTEKKQQLKEYTSSLERSTMVGMFGRVSYNYKQKYFASVTLRRDASSKFGENTRWGTFPSYAIAYTFSEEPYMDWARDFMDHGKIRLSYGKSGKQFEHPYLAFGVLAPGTIPFHGNQTISPFWNDGLLNPKLSWEETRQFDAGLDLDFFNNRLGVVLDYYYRYTDKLLTLVSLPGDYNAYVAQWQNAYAISNQGLELQIKADLIQSEKLHWDINFNIARNWNRLEKSNNGMDFVNRVSAHNLNIIGKPLNGIYVYNDQGYYNSRDEIPSYYIDGKQRYLSPLGNQIYTPGDRRIQDVDGNGRIATSVPLLEDRVYGGSPLPLAFGGIATSLEWKNLDLNLLFSYKLGRHVLNAGRGASVGTTLKANTSEMMTPILADLDKISFWQKPGDNTDFPVNELDNGKNNFATNLKSNIEKINYLKLKSISIGYTLPVFPKQSKHHARVFMSVENVFTITNSSSPDPESIDIVTGIDSNNNYPLATRFTLGLTLNL